MYVALIKMWFCLLGRRPEYIFTRLSGLSSRFAQNFPGLVCTSSASQEKLGSSNRRVGRPVAKRPAVSYTPASRLSHSSCLRNTVLDFHLLSWHPGINQTSNSPGGALKNNFTITQVLNYSSWAVIIWYVSTRLRKLLQLGIKLDAQVFSARISLPGQSFPSSVGGCFWSKTHVCRFIYMIRY